MFLSLKKQGPISFTFVIYTVFYEMLKETQKGGYIGLYSTSQLENYVCLFSNVLMPPTPSAIRGSFSDVHNKTKINIGGQGQNNK